MGRLTPQPPLFNTSSGHRHTGRAIYQPRILNAPLLLQGFNFWALNVRAAKYKQNGPKEKRW